MFVRAVVNPEQRQFFKNSMNLLRGARMYKVKQLVETFEKYTGKDFYRYRAELRKLSQLTFDAANLQTILNTDTLSQNKVGWNVITDAVWEQLRELPENSYIMPIDDDDWVNPFIDLSSQNSSLCYWNMTFFNSVTGRYMFRDVLESEPLKTCSYAVASRVIVDAIKNNFEENKIHLTSILLKHGHALQSCMALEKNNFTRVFLDKRHYGCRLLHLSNLSGATVLNQTSGQNENSLIKNNVMTYDNIQSIRPPDKPKLNLCNWTMPYAELAYNINKRYYTRTGG